MQKFTTIHKKEKKMIAKQLYSYERQDGGKTITPDIPEGLDYTLNGVRLIADEGKALTQDGVNYFNCIDTDSVYGWFEVDAPEYPDIH